MPTLEELENELHDKRKLCGWYGMHRDHAMHDQLAGECYELSKQVARLQSGLY